MPVSPLTPLSLTAQINIIRLKEAFRELEQEHGFYVDPGIWCCRTCARDEAWEEGPGKPFVFWHEQNEGALHECPDQPMPLYYGIAKEDAKEEEIVEVAKGIISVLEQYDLPCQWNNQDIDEAIFVRLDKHLPIKRASDDDDQQDDHLEVALYLPKNEETKDYCWNESFEEHGEPADRFYFYQAIDDGESLKDALMKIKSQIRKFITHYQRCATSDDCTFTSEPIFSIDDRYGHAGVGDSLREALSDGQLEKNPDPTLELAATWLKQDFREWLNQLVVEQSQAERWSNIRVSTPPEQQVAYQLARSLELLHQGQISANDVYVLFKNSYSAIDVKACFDSLTSNP